MNEYIVHFVRKSLEPQKSRKRSRKIGLLGAKMRVEANTPEEAATALFTALHQPQIPDDVVVLDNGPTMGVGDFANVYNSFDDSDITHFRRQLDGWEEVSKEVADEPFREDADRVLREALEKMGLS